MPESNEYVYGAIASPDPNLRVLTAQLVAITGGDILSPTGPLQHITQWCTTKRAVLLLNFSNVIG